MAKSFMEMIFIDSEGAARYTDMRRSADSNAATLAEFRSFRRFGVDVKKATFLLDYHNAKGDLSDTIAVDDAGFRAITGHKPKTEAAYVKMDSDFWQAVQKNRKAA